MKEKIIPCIYYYYLHSKIWESTKGGEISIVDLKKYLFQWKLPHKLRPLIIKELLLLGLLKKSGRHYVEVIRSTFNEEEINRYYEKLKIF